MMELIMWKKSVWYKWSLNNKWFPGFHHQQQQKSKLKKHTNVLFQGKWGGGGTKGGGNQRQILSLIHCTKSEQTNVASGECNSLHVRHLLDSTVSKCGWLSKSDSLDLFSATAGGFWVKVLWWGWRHRCYENHKNNYLNYDKFIFAETWLTWLGTRNAGR